jgi:hypothetical protein
MKPWDVVEAVETVSCLQDIGRRAGEAAHA